MTVLATHPCFAFVQMKRRLFGTPLRPFPAICRKLKSVSHLFCHLIFGSQPRPSTIALYYGLKYRTKQSRADTLRFLPTRMLLVLLQKSRTSDSERRVWIVGRRISREKSKTSRCLRWKCQPTATLKIICICPPRFLSEASIADNQHYWRPPVTTTGPLGRLFLAGVVIEDFCSIISFERNTPLILFYFLLKFSYFASTVKLVAVHSAGFGETQPPYSIGIGL